MIDLISREAWDVDETGSWRRVPWIGRGVVVLAVVLSVFFGHRGTGGKPGMPAAWLIGLALVEGIFVGWLFSGLYPQTSRRKFRKLMDEVYRGDDKTVAGPPSGSDYAYRLVCVCQLTFEKREKRMQRNVPGILYIGRSGLLFAPKKNQFSSDSLAPPIPLQDIRVSVDPGLVKKTLLEPTPQPPVELSWAEGQMWILVPGVFETAEKIRCALLGVNMQGQTSDPQTETD